MKHPSTSRQRGVFTIITAIGAVLLVVILGFVVDGTRLMVIQGELQNATDACALAAAAELNGQPGATFRAAAAGSQVGGALNKKNFQATSVAIASSDVKFSTSVDGTYVAASGSSVNYRFAQCTATHSGWINLFMGLVGLGADEPVASSKAGLQQTRKVCVLPLALKTTSSALSPNFGYVPGALVDIPNNLRIANYETPVLSGTANEYSELIKGFGYCNVSTEVAAIPANVIGFDGDNTMSPALTALSTRYSSDPTLGSDPGPSSRRLLAVPFVRDATPSSATVRGWACLELGSSGTLTYRGNATSQASFLPTSPCVAAGVAGFGAQGPFTPVLVK